MILMRSTGHPSKLTSSFSCVNDLLLDHLIYSRQSCSERRKRKTPDPFAGIGHLFDTGLVSPGKQTVTRTPFQLQVATFTVCPPVSVSVTTCPDGVQAVAVEVL